VRGVGLPVGAGFQHVGVLPSALMGFYERLSARWRRADPALVFQGTSLSYGDLMDRVQRAAGWLVGQGLVSGDVLMLQTPRCLAFLEVHLAALALGVVTLPLNPAYTEAEIEFYRSDSKAKRSVLIGGGDVSAAVLSEALSAAEPMALPGGIPGDHPALLCYTSGTTGRPKGAVITHDNLAGTVLALHEAWHWSRSDVLLHALPLFHIHGLIVAQLGALYAGACAIWMARFEPQIALTMMANCTVFMGVPTFYHRILALPQTVSADLSGMRLLTSGSAPLPAQAHAALQARFGQRILERYGMTEAGIVLSNPYDGERRPGAVGFPLPGVSVRLVDAETGLEVVDGAVGEIQIRGPGVIPGYLNLPEQTAAAFCDGWLCSGDLARRDADGYICIVGRAKDLIITGGLNVYPVEVERILLEHSGVSAVAVVGIPDAEWGERVVAAVIPVAGVAVASEALIAFARQHLAPYKCPRMVRLVDDFPRNAMGKVQKARLRAAWVA
jgi:malonyl-CoA/methylmalonyl-CoA synthetase